METQDAISRIILLIGGKENINNVWHCMTRLRFDLIDDNKVEKEEIKKLPGVLGAQLQSDQFQIIIGPKVSSWYERLLAALGPVGEEAAEKPHQCKGLVSLFMDTVSGVFGPIVPAIAGAGMIKGLLAELIALKAVPQNSDTVMIIDLIASGVFYFLPFFLAVSAAKIFKTNEYLAVAVAACLMYPTLIDAAKALAAHRDGAASAL
jgi:beta-glucoside PTS system EIICBA component